MKFYKKSSIGHLVGLSVMVPSRHRGVFLHHLILEAIRMERCQHRDGVHCLLSPNLLCLCCMLYLQMAIILNKPDVLRRRLPFYNHKRVRAASGTETWVHWISSRACYRLGHSYRKGGWVPQGDQLFPFKFEKKTMKNKFQAFKFKGQRSSHPIFLT